jgi:hypothetical protein
MMEKGSESGAGRENDLRCQPAIPWIDRRVVPIAAVAAIKVARSAHLLAPLDATTRIVMRLGVSKTSTATLANPDFLDLEARARPRDGTVSCRVIGATAFRTMNNTLFGSEQYFMADIHDGVTRCENEKFAEQIHDGLSNCGLLKRNLRNRSNRLPFSRPKLLQRHKIWHLVLPNHHRSTTV